MALKDKFQPLYKQVHGILTERLVSGYWKAGQVLPSEFGLADELGVSQGTVRKALNQMVDEKLLERRQGKGTYVAEHSHDDSLYRFFRLKEPKGNNLLPDTEVLSIKRRTATAEEAKHLSLGKNKQVAELIRLRSLNERPAIIETVIQPLSIFPDIDKAEELPNALYILYQEKYGVNIVCVRDELRAVQLPKRYAEQLGLEVGSPVLMIERESVAMDGKVVEWSRSYSNSSDFVYGVEIR